MDRLLWNGIIERRTERGGSYRGTGITIPASRVRDNRFSSCTSIINDPAPPCGPTYNSACSSGSLRFARSTCFSTFIDDPSAQSCDSAAFSKKTSACYASTACFASTTALSSDHAAPLAPCSGSALGPNSGPRASPSRTCSSFGGDSPLSAGKCDSYGVRRCL